MSSIIIVYEKIANKSAGLQQNFFPINYTNPLPRNKDIHGQQEAVKNWVANVNSAFHDDSTDITINSFSSRSEASTNISLTSFISYDSGVMIKSDESYHPSDESSLAGENLTVHSDSDSNSSRISSVSQPIAGRLILKPQRGFIHRRALNQKIGTFCGL